MACSGLPVFAASPVTPPDRTTVLQAWANALGMSGDVAERAELTSIEYWGTGTVTVNGEACRLTTYHASVKYQVPGMRVEFACVDARGQAHHEIQVVANQLAWNEAVAGGGTTSAMGARDARLIQLWSGPVAVVKAAEAAGTKTTIVAEGGKTVVTFPVPGVNNATVKATLNAQHQAAQVETHFGATVLQTSYTDYAALNGTDFRFDTIFPRHIVQKQGDVTLVDLTVNATRVVNLDTIMTVPDRTVSPSIAPLAVDRDTARGAPSSWKDKQSWAKLDASLRATVESGCQTAASVIVRTKPGYREGLRDSLKAHGNQPTAEFASINAVAVSVSCGDLQTLAGFDSTLSVSVNARVTAATVDVPMAPTSSTSATAPSTADVSGREAEGQAAARQQRPMLQTLLGDSFTQLRGDSAPYGSVGVAVIDSGLEAGPDFGDRITAFYDFTHGDIRATAPSDEYGHGTHVAGLVASRYVGVAPNARLIGLKVLDAHGQGSADSVMRAIEFAIANKNNLGIRILNLSLGHPIYEHAATDPMVQEVEHAVRAGLVVVLSAGNAGLNPATGLPGSGGILSPGNAPSAFSIGAVRTHDTATRDDDEIALFSSRGPSRYDGFVKPDFSAPGQNVLSVAAAGSTLRLAQEARGNSGNYMRLNGTSMAAGVASGLAVLALQANPGLTPNALKAILEFSAIDVKSDGVHSASAMMQGVGEVSGGVVALARTINTRVSTGRPWLVAAVSPSIEIAGESMSWVQRMMWGNALAFGPKLLAGKQLAWATAIPWGGDDNIVWGNNIVWGGGDNIVWGNSLLTNTDDNIVWGNSLFDDNIVWGNSFGGDDNIVWGNSLDDNIIWGNSLDDNIVWGNSADLSDTDVFVAELAEKAVN